MRFRTLSRERRVAEKNPSVRNLVSPYGYRMCQASFSFSSSDRAEITLFPTPVTGSPFSDEWPNPNPNPNRNPYPNPNPNRNPKVSPDWICAVTSRFTKLFYCESANTAHIQSGDTLTLTPTLTLTLTLTQMTLYSLVTLVSSPRPPVT